MRGFFMYFTYILYSIKLDKFYTGYTSNLEERLQYHNKGRVNFTSKGIPWELKYFEEFLNEVDAVRREREIKGKKSRKYI